jgi:hypothetical protein
MQQGQVLMRYSFIILQIISLISIVAGGIVLSCLGSDTFIPQPSAKLIVITGSLG